jgi:hypothetical protein
VKKRWVVTGIIFATIVPSLSFAESDVLADDGIVKSSFPTLFGQSLTPVKASKQTATIVPYAAVPTPTIDDLKDTATDLNEQRTVSYDNSNYQNVFTVSGTGTDDLAHNETINGTNYTILTPTKTDVNKKTGAVAFNQQIDMTKDWSFNFNIDLVRLNSAGF